MNLNSPSIFVIITEVIIRGKQMDLNQKRCEDRNSEKGCRLENVRLVWRLNKGPAEVRNDNNSNNNKKTFSHGK